LSEEQRLWEQFSVALSSAGINPMDYKDDFDAFYRSLQNKPYEEKFNKIMDLASTITREKLTRQEEEKEEIKPNLMDEIQKLREAIERLRQSLQQPLQQPQVEEILTPLQAEIAFVKPSKAVIQRYDEERGCIFWSINHEAEGIMNRFANRWIVKRFTSCIYDWKYLPGGCQWLSDFVEDNIKFGFIPALYADWMRGLAKEIDAKYMEEGVKPC